MLVGWSFCALTKSFDPSMSWAYNSTSAMKYLEGLRAGAARRKGSMNAALFSTSVLFGGNSRPASSLRRLKRDPPPTGCGSAPLRLSGCWRPSPQQPPGAGKWGGPKEAEEEGEGRRKRKAPGTERNCGAPREATTKGPQVGQYYICCRIGGRGRAGADGPASRRPQRDTAEIVQP